MPQDCNTCRTPVAARCMQSPVQNPKISIFWVLPYICAFIMTKSMKIFTVLILYIVFFPVDLPYLQQKQTKGNISLPRRNDDHGRPWSARYLTADHVLSWSTIKNRIQDHGLPWSTTVYRGLPQSNLFRPQSTTVRNCWPWSTMVETLSQEFDHGLTRSKKFDHGQKLVFKIYTMNDRGGTSLKN